MNNQLISDLSNGVSREELFLALEAALAENNLLQNWPIILNIWGYRSSGKTTFLQDLETRLKKNSKGYPVSSWDVQKSSGDNLKQDILSAIANTAKGQISTILLDNIESLLGHEGTEREAFYAFEQEVILPIIEHKMCLCVITSQIEIRQWREYRVKTQQISYKLPALTPKEITELSKVAKLDPEKVFALTLGHPAAASWLMQEPSLSEDQLAERASNYFLQGLPETVQSLAKTASLLPLFNVLLLRLAVEQEENPESFYAKYLEEIHVLIRNGLLFWNIQAGAYQFCDSAVRILIARAVKYQSPAHHQNTHQVALEYYQSSARRPDFLHLYFVGAIYHLAQLSDPRSDHVFAWLESNQRSWHSANWSKVFLAWQEQLHDPAFHLELKGLLGISPYQKIESFLNQMIQEHVEINS